jgi:hypothetical protein
LPFSELAAWSTFKTFFMEMTMKVNGNVLNSIRVYVPMSKDERYLAWLKNELRLMHQHMLFNEQAEPIFSLVCLEKE